MEPAPRETVAIVYRCQDCHQDVRHVDTWRRLSKQREGAPASLPCPSCGDGSHCDPQDAFLVQGGRLGPQAPIEKVWFRGRRLEGVRPWWHQP